MARAPSAELGVWTSSVDGAPSVSGMTVMQLGLYLHTYAVPPYLRGLAMGLPMNLAHLFAAFSIETSCLLCSGSAAAS